MPVHLMGKPAEMDAINGVAKKYNLYVIEDAAEAHGAMYKGKIVGTLADLAAFSLYVAHIITTVEGGVVSTDNEESQILIPLINLKDVPASSVLDLIRSRLLALCWSLIDPS